jgi:hypothetical protein
MSRSEKLIGINLYISDKAILPPHTLIVNVPAVFPAFPGNREM